MKNVHAWHHVQLHIQGAAADGWILRYESTANTYNERYQKKEAEEEEVKVRLQNIKEQLASGYITDFIESTLQETIEKLELLENDLLSLDRYEDVKLVRARIEQLNSAN